MTFEHPLAYLAGLEGLALLRAFTGEHNREFIEARLAELRALLDDPALANAGVDVAQLDSVTGYRAWSPTYDRPDNPAFVHDERFLRESLDGVPPGLAVDAACGTGRLSELLAGLGHRVVGVDSSPDMLALARKRLPEADFREGDLGHLPVGDGQAAVVTCSLALTHVPDLAPVFAEFARILAPGGHLVVVDVHPEWILRGSIPSVYDEHGNPGRLPGYRHLVGDYLRAAWANGLAPTRCEEPVPTIPSALPEAAGETGPWEVWPWSLAAMVPAAAAAANAGVPTMLLWHFRREQVSSR